MSARRAAHARRQLSVDYPRYPPQSSATQQAPLNAIQQIPASDYESDNQGYGSDYPTKPPPAARTNEELNLSVLKRHNRDTIAILSIAAYAVIYEFSPVPEPTWSKSGVEGTLFICQLSPGIYGEERYTAMILNRRGLDNFEAALCESDEGGVEITDQYVIISTKEGHQQKIYGVFIFSEGAGSSTEQARAANAELMKSLAVAGGISRQAGEAAAASIVAQHRNGHVQEAESALDDTPAMQRELSLQQMFGQHRADDASWSVKAHNFDGAYDQRYQPQPVTTMQVPPQASSGAGNDVLGDLFRRAGLQ